MNKKCLICEQFVPQEEYYKNDGICDICERKRQIRLLVPPIENEVEFSSICRKCGREGGAEKFGWRKVGEALRDICIECSRKARKERPPGWKEEIKKIADKRYYQKNKLKVQAHQAVFMAIYHGVLPPLRDFKCMTICCERQAEHYHHYKGYTKENWLDVIPLCKECHIDIHRKYPKIHQVAAQVR